MSNSWTYMFYRLDRGRETRKISTSDTTNLSQWTACSWQWEQGDGGAFNDPVIARMIKKPRYCHLALDLTTNKAWRWKKNSDRFILNGGLGLSVHCIWIGGFELPMSSCWQEHAACIYTNSKNWCHVTFSAGWCVTLLSISSFAIVYPSLSFSVAQSFSTLP